MKRKNIKGITLTETMVATLVFVFIMAGLYTTLLAGNVSWQNYEITVRAQQEARKAVTAMTRDLRVAGTLTFTEQTTSSVIFTFTHPSDGIVIYSWATTGENANRLIRQTTLGSRTVALNIFSFSITDSTRDITLDLTSTVGTAQGSSSSFRLQEKVAKR